MSTFSASSLPAAPTAGQVHGRHTVTAVHELPDLQATLILLEHENGARHAHILRDDDNAAFAVTFPTVPQDSTGVAHILEHNALMGSRRFPLPDPFFSMLPRSLNTFMNAFTAADWTCYPFSTRNRKDYFNLLSVYLDATFFPLLRRESFLQDGWRLEHREKGDPSSPLQFGGVVFNEMKGAMSHPSSVENKALAAALYPSGTYANNSGGDPLCIPRLSWEGMRRFHQRHYHPSNAYFYTYGKLPLEEILEVIEREVMSQFEAAKLDVSIPLEAPFEAPKRVKAHYAGNDSERGASATVVWRLENASDAASQLRWAVLSDILLGNAAAPLTRVLIESKLGSALSDISGHHDHYLEPCWGAGLKGMANGQSEAAEQLVLETLAEIANHGLDPEIIESSLHGFELQAREASNAGFPFGLDLMFGMLGAWMHGNAPERHLQVGAEIKTLREELARGPVFEPMIEDLLRSNNRVTLALEASEHLASEQAEAENALLAELVAALSDEDRAQILRDEAALAAAEEAAADEGKSLLPTLTLNDVTRTLPRPSYTTTKPQNGLIIGRIPQPTGGLVYVDVLSRLPELPTEVRGLSGLYANFLPKSGAGERDHLAMARRLEAVTGGVGCSVGVGLAPDGAGQPWISFTLSGKALERNTNELSDVLGDLLHRPRFAEERLRQLLATAWINARSHVASAGNAYAERAAAARVSESSALSEELSGVAMLHKLRHWAKEDQDLSPLLGRFEEITKAISASESFVALTASGEAALASELGALKSGFSSVADRHISPKLQAGPLRIVANCTVHFNAAAWQTAPFFHEDSPALLALSHLLRSEYLLKEIREKGGAYGASASLDWRSGVFTVSSYRDPECERSFAAFDNIGPWLEKHLPSDEALHESLLSASKRLDPLTSPDTVGRMRFFSDMGGLPVEEKEAYLERLLAVNRDDLLRAAAWLDPTKAGRAAVTPAGALAARAADWHVVDLSN